MGEPGLIDAYLTELRYSLSGLADAEDVLGETADHLLSAFEALVAAGRAPANAEAQALARFGSASLVAHVFLEEAKRGGAVSTQLTRWAGLAAMACPVLLITGLIGNEAIDRGFLHGAAVALLLLAFGAFAFALWGLRRRHGGLGTVGRVAFWLFVASPFLSAPFTWMAGVVFVLILLAIVTLLGIGMVQARILPPAGVGLFAFVPGAAVVATVVASAATEGRALVLLPIGAALSAIGLAWVGLCLWREPALDVRSGSDAGPLATA